MKEKEEALPTLNNNNNLKMHSGSESRLQKHNNNLTIQVATLGLKDLAMMGVSSNILTLDFGGFSQADEPQPGFGNVT